MLHQHKTVTELLRDLALCSWIGYPARAHKLHHGLEEVDVEAEQIVDAIQELQSDVGTVAIVTGYIYCRQGGQVETFGKAGLQSQPSWSCYYASLEF